MVALAAVNKLGCGESITGNWEHYTRRNSAAPWSLCCQGYTDQSGNPCGDVSENLIGVVLHEVCARKYGLKW